MNVKRLFATPFVLLFAGSLALTVSGCQSNIGGQTLPSAYYLRDDVQFFPAGPETQLPETRRAAQEYRATQAAAAEAIAPAP